MIKIALLGSSGKMGCAVLEQVDADNSVLISNAIVRSNSDSLGMDVKSVHSKVKAELKFVDYPNQEFDLFLDFSTNFNLDEKIKMFEEFNKPLIFCGTGLSDLDEKRIKSLSLSMPVMFAPNTSIGVNAMIDFLKRMKESLDVINITIEEKHHISKIDAPSGTAIDISNQLETAADEITSIRDQSVENYHKIGLICKNEKFEITHFGLNRKLYAEGAINIAKWFYQKPKNLYYMQTLIKEIYE